jgi:IS30 family transposase
MSKGKVTQKEKEKMWRLYQELGSFKKVASRLRRSPDTVSRHVREYEAAVGAAGYVMNAKDRVKQAKK